jgi:hypothetical protein
MRILTFYQSKTSSKEDTAIIPYLFIIHVKGEDNLKLRGIGISLLNHSISIALGVNIPKGYPFFSNITNQKTND